MILGYLLLGVFTGLLSFCIALILGASVGIALLLYTAVGVTSILLFPVLRLVAETLSDRFARNPDVAEDAAGSMQPIVAFAGDVQASVWKMNILAVDDEPFILELIPKIAAKAGYSDVTTASSGQQALDVIAGSGKTFDCLVLDINMPGMDGIALCAQIRRIPGYRNTPIIMLTAMTDMNHLERAFKAGATDYTPKPFDIIEFGERLQKAEALVTSQRQQAETARTDVASPPKTAGVQRYDLLRTMRTAGLQDMLEYGALENYLTQLSKSAAANAYVMAVSVDRIEAQFAETPPPAFLHALTRVAFAINSVFKSSGYAMAYAAHGRFVIVSNRAILPSPMAVEADIQDRFEQLLIHRGTAGPDAITISVGQPVRPVLGKAERAKVAFEAAMRFAEDRAAEKEHVLKPREVSLFRR